MRIIHKEKLLEVVPIEQTTKELISAAGLEPVDDNSKEYEVDMEIRLKGEIPHVPMEILTARVEGTIDMEGPDHRIRSSEIQGRAPVIFSIEQTLTDYDRALINSNFWKVLGELIDATYGSEASLNYWMAALKNKNLQDKVVKDLGVDKLKVAHILIGQLKNAKAEDRSLRRKVELRDLLKKLTGQDFGVDPDAWQKWWYAQPKETASK